MQNMKHPKQSLKLNDDISRFDLNFKNIYLTDLMIYGQDEVLQNCEKEFKKYLDSKQKEIKEGIAILEIETWR